MTKIGTAAVRAFLATNAAVLAMVPALAYGQQADAPAQDAPAKQPDEIVVTGTLIRGTPPVGSNQISLGQQKIEETGAISTNELLASLPQVTNYFNREPLADLGGAAAVNQIQVSRPNLRNISPSNASSSATLILLDGHRIASVGVNQASIDPDLIPTGAIERVEVVTEGGSATYGADAVAGVINFITRKRFDGIKVDAHYGMARDYYQMDANVTAGKTWDTGSAYVSYTYTKNDALYGRDRSFISNLDYSRFPYVGRDTACNNPNLAVNTVLTAFGATIASTNYAAPGYVAGTTNHCDNSKNGSYIPYAQRHGVFGGLSQDFGSATKLDVRAFYSQRKTDSFGDLTGVVAVSPSNPYGASSLPPGLVLGTQPYTIFGSPVVNQAAVSFDMAPLLGANSQHSGTTIKEWGANAELKHDFSKNWQVRALANWSQSDSSYFITQLSPSALGAAGSGTTAATAFNPFNVTNNNPALVAALKNSEITGQARDSLLQMRLIAEGKLFDLPGGDARLAFGYEFVHDNLKQRFQSDIAIGTLGSYPYTAYSRNVNSAFGELQLPLISDGNAGSMLTVSAAARYDRYSDFGHTFNPKLGATFRPAHWLGFRANWGTSFTAPTPLDQLGSQRNTISAFPFVAFTNGTTPPGGSYTVALQGSQPNLQPQTAHTWSVGVDLDPVPYLHASVNYYDVNFKNILSTPTPSNLIFTYFPNNIVVAPAGLTPAQLTAIGLQAPGGTAVVNSLISSGTLVYEYTDFRTGNFGILHVKGIDFSLNATAPTEWGAFDFAVNGNRPLSRKQQASPTAAVADNLATENPKLYLQTSIGATAGGFRAQATWDYTGGYAILPTTSVPVQTHVNSFSTVNLFFKYNVPEKSGVLANVSVTLNVSNVLDKDPPYLLRNNPGESGFANGFTFGRMFTFGVSKKI